jgi:spermidine synthase
LDRRTSFAAVLALLFCSGFCALVYQVLWLRQLSLVFGVTIHAASTVLAAFMMGLAVGSLLAGRLARRIVRPLAAFGLVEIMIGLSALATPLGLEAADVAYGWLHRRLSGGAVPMTLARLSGSFLVLLVPTMLMGLTLPFLTASTLVRNARFGSRVGALYAANTTGAVVGAIAAGFVLIGGLGMRRTFMVAALVNVVAGLLAIVVQKGVPESGTAATAPPADVRRAAAPWPVPSIPPSLMLAVVAVSGLASLALEIVWFRMLLQFFDATAYAFTMMLATVLAGIACGGIVSTRILARPRDLSGTLAAVLSATGLAIVVSAIVLASVYGAGWLETGAVGVVQACVLAILPAAVSMGVAFPIALRLGAIPRDSDLQDGARVARRIGQLYAVNVIGAIAGALIAGFGLLPALGTRRALVTLAALYGATAVGVALAGWRRGSWSRATLVAVTLLLALAWYVPDPFVVAIAQRHGDRYREVWRDEGAQTAVSVAERDGARMLFLDGLLQASDAAEMVHAHRTIGHLAMLLHPNPRRVLVVGMGGGATPGAISQHQGAHVQIVELSDSVARASAQFAHINYDVLNRPNVSLRLDDGRSFLKYDDRRFDVITADMIQASQAGGGNLYSREYFALVRRALAPGGLFVQWNGERPAHHYKLIMRTFLSVFPDASAWANGALMVGTLEPLALDLSRLHDRVRDPVTRAALEAIGIETPDDLAGLYTAGADQMRRYAGDGPVLTDDRPLLEYYRSLPRTGGDFEVKELRGK